MKYIILCGGIQKTSSLPNPLNYVNGRHVIEYIIENIPCNEIYIFYNIYLKEYNFEDIISNLFKDRTLHFVAIDYLTRGPAETAYIGLQQFTDNDSLVFIDNDNVHNIPKLENKNFIGYGNQGETHYSFIEIENNLVTKIKEKVKISDNYCSGIYGFKSASVFKKYCYQLLTNHGEYYFSQIYNLMLLDNIPITPIYIQYTKLNGNENKLFFKQLRVCFDLDTLITENANPIHKNIQLLKHMKQTGHEVIIHTSRNMNLQNIGKAIKNTALDTINALERYNIEYDELIFGKPYADIYIDNKALNPQNNNISYFGIDINQDEFIHNKVTNNKFNQIQKNENIIKKTGPYSILKGELYYYQNIPPQMSQYFPRLYNFNKIDNTVELFMEHVKGIPLYFLYKNKLVTESILDDLLDILHQFHKLELQINIAESNVHNNYFKKLKDRFNTTDFCFPDAQQVFDTILSELERTYNPCLCSMIHGDFWFSNILVNYHEYKVLDMKGQVDGLLTLNGDMYYDYGKLYQSILGYDLVLNGCEIDEKYLERMKELFLGKCSGLDIPYLTAVTKALMLGTISFIENQEAKLRVWEFVKR